MTKLQNENVQLQARPIDLEYSDEQECSVVNLQHIL